MKRIKQSIDVNAPIEECYKVMIDFGNYGRLIPALKKIERKGDPNVWHWEFTGPEERPVAFDLELDAMRHNNHVISWHTIRDAVISHSGAITLERSNGNQTKVNVVIDYSLPSETFGQALKLADPDVLNAGVVNSMKKLKSLLESKVKSPS